MTKLASGTLFGFLSAAPSSASALAAAHTPATCSISDVQVAINSDVDWDTVLVPDCTQTNYHSMPAGDTSPEWIDTFDADGHTTINAGQTLMDLHQWQYMGHDRPLYVTS